MNTLRCITTWFMNQIICCDARRELKKKKLNFIKDKITSVSKTSSKIHWILVSIHSSDPLNELKEESKLPDSKWQLIGC